MEREMTNSITHLVKIVAREVAEAVVRENMIEVAGMQEECKEIIRAVTKEHLTNVQSSIERAGVFWTDQEHELLHQELQTAIAQIAKNHKRSIGAIKAALRHKIAKHELD